MYINSKIFNGFEVDIKLCSILRHCEAWQDISFPFPLDAPRTVDTAFCIWSSETESFQCLRSKDLTWKPATSLNGA
jgi:hypothetical protein